MEIVRSRRRFMVGAAAAGAASRFDAGRALAEAPRETPTARFADFLAGSCVAPQYIAEGLLRGEGFSDFRYVPVGDEATGAASGFARSSPRKIIADGTDWHFRDGLERELKT